MSVNTPQGQSAPRLDLVLLLIVIVVTAVLTAAIVTNRELPEPVGDAPAPAATLEINATPEATAEASDSTDATPEATAEAEAEATDEATPETTSSAVGTPEGVSYARLTPEATDDSMLEVTPEATADPAAAFAGMIVFMSNRDGDWDVYTLDLATGTLTNLTDNTADDGFAGYSMDGKQISFLSNEDRAEGAQLGGFLMDADGRNRARAAADLPTFMNILMNGRGDWDVRTTDGANTPLVMVSLRDLNMEIYARRDGKDTNLSRSGAIDWYASWSPDEMLVVFASDRVDAQHDIFIANADGSGEPRRLTDAPQDDWSPVFTRDGRWIIFASERDGLLSATGDLLHAIDMSEAGDEGIPEATPARLLTISAAAETILDAGAVTQGGVTVFMSNRDGNWELYAEPAGGEAINLTNDPGDDIMPLWLPAAS